MVKTAHWMIEMRSFGYRKVLGAGALALGVALGAQAEATTINFATGGNGTAAGGTVAGGPSYTTSSAAGNTLFPLVGTVTQSVNGLGVSHFLDGLPAQIDALTGFEAVTITFAWAVRLTDFSLGLLDSNDDLAWSVNGGAFTQIGPGIINPVTVNENFVMSFTIIARRTLADGFPVGNDDFTLSSANISTVPVPAAGLMLLMGLGGLGALRRKRKAI